MVACRRASNHALAPRPCRASDCPTLASGDQYRPFRLCLDRRNRAGKPAGCRAGWHHGAAWNLAQYRLWPDCRLLWSRRAPCRLPVGVPRELFGSDARLSLRRPVCARRRLSLGRAPLRDGNRQRSPGNLDGHLSLRMRGAGMGARMVRWPGRRAAGAARRGRTATGPGPNQASHDPAGHHGADHPRCADACHPALSSREHAWDRPSGPGHAGCGSVVTAKAGWCAPQPRAGHDASNRDIRARASRRASHAALGCRCPNAGRIAGCFRDPSSTAASNDRSNSPDPRNGALTTQIVDGPLGARL